MLFPFLHRRVARLDFWDLKLVAGASLCFAWVLARYIPEIIDANPWWWLGIGIFLAVRPLAHFWLPEVGESTIVNRDSTL